MGAVIDIHTHIVPSRLAADPKRDRRWPSVALSGGDQAAVMIAGRVFRKIDTRSWDVDRRLEDMVDDGTDMQVLSPMPELLSHWLPPDDAEYLADVMNDEIAAMMAKRAPRHFAGIGMVCERKTLRARCVSRKRSRREGFAGIEIGNAISMARHLATRACFPLYEAAEALDLGIFVHPLHPAGMERVDASSGVRGYRRIPVGNGAGLSVAARGRGFGAISAIAHPAEPRRRRAVMDLAADGFWLVAWPERQDDTAAFEECPSVLV